MLDFVFYMECERLLHQISQKDFEAVLSILAAYAKEAKDE